MRCPSARRTWPISPTRGRRKNGKAPCKSAEVVDEDFIPDPIDGDADEEMALAADTPEDAGQASHRQAAAYRNRRSRERLRGLSREAGALFLPKVNKSPSPARVSTIYVYYLYI